MTLSGRGRRVKGATAERAVAAHLRERGFLACKRNVDRRKDEGDLIGVGDLGIEVKNQKAMALSAWLTQAQESAARAGLRWPVVVVKKRGVADPGGWYVVTTLDTFLDVAWTGISDLSIDGDVIEG